MKPQKRNLSEINNINQAIRAIEAKSQDRTRSSAQDGSLSVSIPITPADLKQLASLRAKLAAADARYGTPKLRTTTAAESTPSTPTPDLLTEQMLAQRWHCSTSRLQRWRAANIGLTYLKIGGKVLYRLDDIRAYEAAHVVNTRAES